MNYEERLELFYVRDLRRIAHGLDLLRKTRGAIVPPLNEDGSRLVPEQRGVISISPMVQLPEIVVSTEEAFSDAQLVARDLGCLFVNLTDGKDIVQKVDVVLKSLDQKYNRYYSVSRHPDAVIDGVFKLLDYFQSSRAKLNEWSYDLSIFTQGIMLAPLSSDYLHLSLGIKILEGQGIEVSVPIIPVGLSLSLDDVVYPKQFYDLVDETDVFNFYIDYIGSGKTLGAIEEDLRRKIPNLTIGKTRQMIGGSLVNQLRRA